MERRPVRPQLALAYYEDGMALASFLDGQGFRDDAANVRQAVIHFRPRHLAAKAC